MKTGYAFALAVAVLITIAYFELQLSGWILLSVTDGLFVLTSGTCLLLALFAVRRWGFRGKLGVVYSGLFLGFFLWFLAETTYAIYDTILQVQIPFVSVGDVFSLVAYVPVTVGLVQFLWTFRVELSRIWSATVLGICLLIFALACLFLVGPLIASAENPLAGAFCVVYPILDLILFVLAFLMFLSFAGGTVARAWVWMSLGLVLRVLFDIALGLGVLQGWYYAGHPIEVIQLWAYISFALGLVEQSGAA
jgi:hypothetical protein